MTTHDDLTAADFRDENPQYKCPSCGFVTPYPDGYRMCPCGAPIEDDDELENLEPCYRCGELLAQDEIKILNDEIFCECCYDDMGGRR